MRKLETSKSLDLGAKLLGYASVWLRNSLVTKSPDFILYT